MLPRDYAEVARGQVGDQVQMGCLGRAGRLDPRRAKVRRQRAGGLVFTDVTELALQVEAPQRRGV